MPEFDSQNTTDPSAPTTSQMEAMWQDLRDYERSRRRSAAPMLERAMEDEALYGEAA